MDDGICCYGYSETLRNNFENSPDLNFTKHENQNTGEFYCDAEYMGLIITIACSGRITITGSLHKYWNKGLHNWNDFKLCDIKNTLTDLAEKFGNEIYYLRVSRMELGFNIRIGIPAADFIKRNIILLKSGARLKEPITPRHVKGFERGLYYVFDEFALKVYNKAGNYPQYALGDNLLRIEYVTRKMRAIKEAQVEYLIDLSDPLKLKVIFKKLLELYECLLIRENVDYRALSKPKKTIYDKVTNPDYWKNITKDARKIKKEQATKLFTEFATTTYKDDVVKLLNNKFNELLN